MMQIIRGVDALMQNQELKDEWLRQYADFSEDG